MTRGRPRDPAVDQRIKHVALEVLAERGFSQFSVDAVCLRAGVPRSTFYRRWPGVLELLADAFHDAAIIDPLPNTGNLLDDLVAYATHYCALLADPVFGACASFLVAEARLRPDLQQRLRRDLVARRTVSRSLFHRAAARGETWVTIDPDLVLDIINGLAMTSGSIGRTVQPQDLELLLERLLGQESH